MSDDRVGERLARIEVGLDGLLARIKRLDENLRSHMKAEEKTVADITIELHSLRDEIMLARGGWKVLMWAGGVLAALAATVAGWLNLNGGLG